MISLPRVFTVVSIVTLLASPAVALAQDRALDARADVLRVVGPEAVAVAPVPRAVVVQPPPPEPRVVVPPSAPTPNHVWVEGHWSWRGRRYSWSPGYWQHPRAGHHWLQARWALRDGAWTLVPGRWVAVD